MCAHTSLAQLKMTLHCLFGRPFLLLLLFFRLEELTESHLELPKVRCTLQRERERSSPEHVLVLFYFLLSCPLSAGPMGCKEIWGHRRERKELEEEGTWPEWPKLFRRLLSSLFLDTINCQSRGSPVVDGNCFPIQDWRPHTHRSPLRPTRREEERRWQSHQIGISLIFWRASVTLDRRAPATDFHHNCWFHTQSVVPAPQNSEEVGGGRD